MKVKEESEKVGLKLNIQKTTIMPSGPITSWQIDGETVETVADFILGGSKITADGDWSHEIKRCLLLGRKAITTLDSIFKSRDYFANKGPYSQSYGFSSSHVWMWVLDYKESEVTQLCPTLSNPMDCSLPGSSIHGILQARILEWVAISFSRGSSWPRDGTQVSRIAGRHFNLWATTQSYGLCGRGRGWEDLGEWHWNM